MAAATRGPSWHGSSPHVTPSSNQPKGPTQPTSKVPPRSGNLRGTGWRTDHIMIRRHFAPRLIPRRRLRRPNRGQQAGGSAECRRDRRSRSADLAPERLSRPDGAAAAEEIMVAGQEAAGVEDEGRWRPVVGVAITSRRPVGPSVYMRDGDSAREPVGKIKRLHRQRLKRLRSVDKLSTYNLR
jgi:hypothetical protein